MRAVQIADLTGPESALKLVDLPEPEPSHPLTPGSGVVIDVHAAGVSFPEVLQTRGEYQIKPDLPFVPGQRGGGHRAQRARGLAVSARATAWRPAACSAPSPRSPWRPTSSPSRCSDELDFAQGAGLILNYHTAYFSLKHARPARRRARPCSCTARPAGSAPRRSRWRRGSARGRSPSCRATRRSGSRARRAPTRSCAPTGPGRTRRRSCRAAAWTSCIDPVGGDRFTDSLRSLREGGRLVVVGFTGGSIPEVRVNRLLLNNLEVVGAGWGAFVMGKRDVNREIGEAREPAGGRGLRAPDRRRALPARAARARRSS